MSKKQNLMNEVMKLAADKAKKSQITRLQKFMRVLYERQGYPDINKIDPSVVADITMDAWEQFLQRKPGEIKVDIYELKLPIKKGGHRIIMNILTDDMAFLVDSIAGYLAQKQLRPRVLLRPIYRVRREEDGQLDDIILAGGPEKGTIQESLIHCETSDPFTKETIEELKKEIPKVLQDIRASVTDWHHMRAKIQDAIAQIKPIPGAIPQEQVSEVIDFMRWLDSEHFTFLGYREYERENGSFVPKKNVGSHLGLLSLSKNRDLGLFYQGKPISTDLMDFIFQNNPLVVTKTTRISPVHRSVPLDSITIKKYDQSGNVIGLNQFLGLFTSIAYNTSARDIPMLRRKVLRVVDLAGYSPYAHDGKTLIHILDSLPRDELFQASEEELLAIGQKVLFIQERPRIAVFIRRDHFDRFLSCLVYVPKDRFEYSLTESIAEILKQELKGKISLTSAQYGGLTFARIHYMISFEGKKAAEFDTEKIEKRIVESSSSWKDNLLMALSEEYGEWEGTAYYQKYAPAFNRGYQERFSVEEAIIDIKYIEKAYKTGNLGVRIYRPKDKSDTTLKIKLYHIGSAIPLSDVIPIMEDMDLHIDGEVPFCIQNNKAPVPIWVHDFETTSREKCPIDIAEINDNFLELFQRVHTGQAESDGFNRLVVRAGLSWRECSMFRTYAKYLRQLRIEFSQAYMEFTLVKHPEVAKLIRDLFIEKFNPKNKKNEKKIKSLRDKIHQELINVENAEEDKILRRFINLVTSTARTNYFQEAGKNDFKSYLSIKLDSNLISEMPAPRPAYEIFVYSPKFEAVHLRASKIARGGIRWSDRREDFRTEILGLLKAQNVKNSVIIPQGAKGGFVLKSDTESMSREEFLAEGINCYKQMMRALLELTDNLVKGDPQHPQNTVCWDDYDPYLVVAADKGTATFSDYANEIAQEKKYWLDDAFASGGSHGYDHKEMGITARGAWESTKRHFWEKGIDIQKTSITATGIGDMSGDVFGNGMLLSKPLKLVAAFNHKHIFIDPDPHPESSFKERKRLFKNRLGWDEYNKNLLSAGGGIFERKAKTLTVSAQIKHLFNLSSNTVTPKDLMRAILKAEVDLLFLGGIGTFVKSRYESHADVGDRTNDEIRINGDELKCKVVTEGANLGLTQRGRIEFAQNGGAINTDAIDNSAGVDCSDHEVNIKILLRDSMTRGGLSFEKRNKLLVSMTDEVAKLVLETNYKQNLVLSLTQAMGAKLLDVQTELIRALERSGQLDRILESLPDDQTLAEDEIALKGLTRPELCVLLPYAKNALYEHVIKTDLPDEDKLLSFLYSYFPEPITKGYKTYIENHPLRREIIATCVVNSVVNHMGASFIEDIREKTGRTPEDAIKAYFIAMEVYNFDAVWGDIDDLDHKMDVSHQTSTFLKVWTLIRRATRWYLTNGPHELAMAETTKIFKSGVEQLYKDLDDCIMGEVKEKLQSDYKNYVEIGLPKKLAKQLARLEIVATSPDILEISRQTKVPVAFVGGLYFSIASRFGFTWLRNTASSLHSKTSWHRTAVTTLIEDLYAYQAKLTKKILEGLSDSKKKKANEAMGVIEDWITQHKNQVVNIDQLLHDSQAVGMPDLAILTVVQRELRLLSEN